MSDIFNIYMTGVGGQGIGLLSQTLLRAIDHAGIRAVAVDTHGLAQRGGVVVSRIRMGAVFSPLILAHGAHLVLAMEIHEALRSVTTSARKGGALCYLDVSWQPLPVRLGQAPAVTDSEVLEACRKKNVKPFRVDASVVEDPRTQNMALIGTVAAQGLIPGVEPAHYRNALSDLLTGTVLEKNRALLEKIAAA